MFSQIPPSYEAQLQSEIWGCHQFMNISYDELDRMPTRLRRFRIQKHNAYINKTNISTNDLTADNFSNPTS